MRNLDQVDCLMFVELAKQAKITGWLTFPTDPATPLCTFFRGVTCTGNRITALDSTGVASAKDFTGTLTPYIDRLTALTSLRLSGLALGGQIGSVRLAVMLVLVIAVGLAAAVLTTRRVTRVPLIPSLRKD